MADIGVWMQPAVLAHKLQARDQRNPCQAWNLARWPSRLSESGPHRLFVANRSAWRGYFRLRPDALYNPVDARAPFTLLFDARSWTPVPRIPASPFRGYTYKVPTLLDDPAPSPTACSCIDSPFS